MKEPTKADLAAAVAKLADENAGLRDLLAAVSLVADTVPIAAPGVPHHKELRRAGHVLGAVKVVANPGGSWAWGHAGGAAAKFLRELAAEPVGYEVYAEPEPEAANPPYRMTGNMIGPCCMAEDGGYICNAQEGHDGPQHVAYGSDDQECHRWPVADGTPVLVTGDEPRICRPICGNRIPEGAWADGYRCCRECLSDRTKEGLARYDRFAAEAASVTA